MPPITTAETQEQAAVSSSTSSILKERRFKLSRRTATLEDRMHHLETLIQAIPPAVFAAGGMVPSNGAQPSTESTGSPVVPFAYPSQFPSGVPPPSLHVFPLTNPSTHFTRESSFNEEHHHGLGSVLDPNHKMTPDQLAEEASHLSLTASYLYFDDEGCTRWQGETSGLPVLDLLVERHTPPGNRERSTPALDKSQQSKLANVDWFPNRTPRHTDVNPQTLWRLITPYIVPELMDRYCNITLAIEMHSLNKRAVWFSAIYPHLTTSSLSSTSQRFFLLVHVVILGALLLNNSQDYGNPEKWGAPGFAAFIVAICCLASRHIDDPRVRANPTDGISAGTHWFELFARLRALPISDRPTLYNIQANLIAAVYAVGLGKLSKAASLLAEAVTMSIDAGLHRCADDYDVFDPIEDEVRKRTFWCVYIWDKQLSAHFGRPPLMRLRDCDVSEPAGVDDEFITRDGVGAPPLGAECRLSAFICSLRIMVVLESVLDVPPARSFGDSSSFLQRATHVLSGSRRFRDMRDEELLLDDIHRNIPSHWAHTPETLASDDIIRLTQAERLHCAEHFVRLLIYRHRFSELMAERTNGGSDEPPGEQEKAALIAAQNSALQIITTHLQVAKKGLMTYCVFPLPLLFPLETGPETDIFLDGVHVIHQLTQAGRTLVAILLSCKTEELQHLIPTGLDALRSCVGLLRRFSGRYVCGLRSGDLMEEFCRRKHFPSLPPGLCSPFRSSTLTVTQIPLETTQREPNANNRPPWIRPVRKKAASRSGGTNSTDSPPQHSSPEGFSPSDFFAEVPKNGPHFASGSMATSTTSLPVSQTFISGNQPQAPFMDTTGMSMDMIREDPTMYMSPTDMMALFDESVDVQQLFSCGFSPQSQSQPSQASPMSLNPDVFDSPGFLKQSGLATSP
ncbi:hypothetical protein H0H87_003987 [Tephrocybe sp. NHM501043]|nr:hypothetical protein H0H87_003987 [Tephrocybe sp. NHM501043]